MGTFNIPQGTDPGQDFASDPQTRKRLVQMVMGSDPSAAMDPPQNDRIADDLTRHPAGFEPEPGSTEDLESRVSSGRQLLLDTMRQNPAQPSRLDQLQSQYDQMKPPEAPAPRKWWQNILVGLGGVGAVNANNARRAQEQQFEEGRYDRSRQSLAQQMEAERRIQEENELADQRDVSAYQRQLEMQREQDLRTAPKTLDTDQGPMQWDMQSRQWSPIMRNGQPVGPKAQPKPDTPEQQAIDYYTSRGMTLPQAITRYAQDTQKPEQPQRPQQMLGVTPDNKVIEIKPGMQLPEGTNTIGGEIKAQQGQEGKNVAIGYANDYLQRGTFTGPGDEALMEKFFEMAKPSSGFRMTEAQMAMLRNAQSWFNSVSAKAHHAWYGTWFSDTQRQQIADTMNEIGKSASRLKQQIKPQSSNGRRVIDISQ